MVSTRISGLSKGTARLLQRKSHNLSLDTVRTCRANGLVMLLKWENADSGHQRSYEAAKDRDTLGSGLGDIKVD